MSFSSVVPVNGVVLDVLCNLACVRQAARDVKRFLCEVGVASKDLHCWELSVTEAGNNAVGYVTELGKSLTVRFEVMVTTSCVQVTVTDHTCGFLLADIPLDPPGIESDHGRGVFLMRQYMDEVLYLRGGDSNSLVLRKSRGKPEFKAEFEVVIRDPCDDSRDLEAANMMQRSLLDSAFPKVPGFDLCSYYCAARKVGGDFYYVATVGYEKFLLVVGDVMGKGVSAAIFASMVRGLLRSRLDLAPSPGKLLEWLNENLFEDLVKVSMFVTLQLVYLDVGSRFIRVAGAGHPPCLLAGCGNPVVEVSSLVPPVGILKNMVCKDLLLTLPKCAKLFMYTDGLSDVRDMQGRLLGVSSLVSWLNIATIRKSSVLDAKQNLLRLIKLFEVGVSSVDDRAFLLLSELD